MTVFEYLAAVFALILGLGVTRLLGSGVEVFRRRRESQLSWIPFAWAALIFATQMQFMWGVFELSQILTGWTRGATQRCIRRDAHRIPRRDTPSTSWQARVRRPRGPHHVPFRRDRSRLVSLYGAGGQDARCLHAVGPRLGRRRPRRLRCRIACSARGGVPRSGAGTILLSGAQHRPIASFGSPGAHSLSRGTRTGWPSPEIQ
jgi:hypothetical protein